MEPIRTACPYCGVGCGVLATADGAGGAVVKGDPDHPANRGRLCSKGSALGDTLDLEDRLLTPEWRGAPIGWDEALDRLADGFRTVIDAHGPDAVAFYISGQMLTEDYYVANKLIKGFIGSANIDTNSRLCMASAVAGHKRAFGEDVVPGCYDDLDLADLTILVGSNAAWCHPVLFRRIEAARDANPAARLVVIDPRRTATATAADLHLAIKPGADGYLFTGLLSHLATVGALDLAYIKDHTTGFEPALAAARSLTPDIAATALATGLSEHEVALFFAMVAETPRMVTAFSMGVNQSSSGSDKVNAILNCHLATGRIGKPGMGPLSLTGQPNAMGGREVGGLANQLAAHMDFASPTHVDRVRRFWKAPNLATKPGLMAVDMFDAIDKGRIKALLVMGTNPAVSMPDGDKVRRALGKLDFLAVADVARTSDTVGFAHLLLPALAWGEKDGAVTNSERMISRQRAFLPPPGDARADWWILTQLAIRLGHGADFAYRNAAAIFREHAALSAFENDGDRDFDLSGLTTLSDDGYDAFAPAQWPIRAGVDSRRRFADGRYSTPDRRARFVAVTPRGPLEAVTDALPMLLNSGRMRDHWHTMTRTAKAAVLSTHRHEPTAELHPDDARRLGVAEGDLVTISGIGAAMIARAVIDPGQSLGSVFAPMHWSDGFGRGGRVSPAIPGAPDPVSGQPELKQSAVACAKANVDWQAVMLSADRPRAAALPEHVHRVHYKIRHGWATMLAGTGPTPTAPNALDRDPDAEFADPEAGRIRALWFDGGRLAAAWLADRDGQPDAAWLSALFGQEASPAEMALAARPASGERPAGPPICVCFGVDAAALAKAITEHGCGDLAAIGKRLGAGTNCGSCRPEISAMIAQLEPVA